MGEAAVIDVTESCNKDPDSQIGIEADRFDGTMFRQPSTTDNRNDFKAM